MSRWFYLAIGLTVAAFAGSLYIYFFDFERLPAKVPTHWNLAGQPDAWTSRERILPTFLVLPGAMLTLLALTPVLPWLSPRQFEVERFRGSYNFIMALVVALLGYLHLAILWGSLARPGQMDLGRYLIAGILLFFAALGGVLSRVRRNFWIGVRTPWTLASERVWDATHRLAAWLFGVGGLASFLLVLGGAPLGWCFAALMVIAVVPVVYSLVLYKRLERRGEV